jgi:hypothetical protein
MIEAKAASFSLHDRLVDVIAALLNAEDKLTTALNVLPTLSSVPLPLNHILSTANRVSSSSTMHYAANNLYPTTTILLPYPDPSQNSSRPYALFSSPEQLKAQLMEGISGSAMVDDREIESVVEQSYPMSLSTSFEDNQILMSGATTPMFIEKEEDDVMEQDFISNQHPVMMMSNFGPHLTNVLPQQQEKQKPLISLTATDDDDDEEEEEEEELKTRTMCKYPHTT